MVERMMGFPKVNISIFETLLARRSVRHYQARDVAQNTISILLEAAIHAPTAAHQEPWGFIVIQDKNLLRQLSGLAKPLFIEETEENGSNNNHNIGQLNKPELNIFYNAGTLILICGNNAAPFFEADCWLAAENLMLAACAMGLGTCVIGNALPVLTLESIKKRLDIPSNYTVVAPVILGYAEDEIDLSSRKKPLILANISAISGDGRQEGGLKG